MPGASYALEALKHFGRNGGKRLLLKFGGYAMPKKAADFENVLKFFGALAQHWKEDTSAGAPVYNPWKLENNLLSFVAR